jgi:hypothetical protein
MAIGAFAGAAFDKVADSSVGKAVLGNTDTAIISVRDFRDKAMTLEKDKQSSATTGLVEGQLRGVSYQPGATFYERRYKVQFNPKELTLNSSQSISSKGSVEQKEKDVSKAAPMAHQPPKITLSMNLIFDEVNLYDSFMSERIFTGLASLATNAVTAVQKHALGKKWTVQPQVEGFIAALRNPYTRTVLFSWNEFSFEGILNQISAEYTMFSVEGRPVRAKVRVKLINDMTLKAKKEWKEYFKEAFENSDSTNLSTVEGYVGNVFNAGSIGL